MVNGASQDKAPWVGADAAPGAGMGETHGAGMDRAPHGSRRTSRPRSSRDSRYGTPLTAPARGAHAGHGTRRIADMVVGAISTVPMRAAVDMALRGDAVDAVGMAAITTVDPIRVARRLAPCDQKSAR